MDGSKELVPFHEMKPWPACDVVRGDIVLLECLLKRTFGDEESWSVDFELNALTLLHPMPRHAFSVVDTGFFRYM